MTMMGGSLGDATLGLRASLKEFNKNLKTAQGKMKGAVGKMQGLANGLKLGAGAAGVAVAGIGIKAVISATEFEKGMREVNTLVGGDESAFKQLQSDTLAFSKEMGLATDKAVPGLYQAISAGVPPENVFQFMEESAKAAIGGSAELSDVIGVTTAILKGYGEEMTEAAKVQDLLQKTVQLGVTTMPELAANMGKVTPLAAALGVPIEELTGAFATLTGVTGNTAEVSTQLRATYQAFVKPTKEMGEAISTVAEELEKQGKLVEGPLVDGWRNAIDIERKAGNALSALGAQIKAAKAGTGDYEAALADMNTSLATAKDALKGQKTATKTLRLELKALKKSEDASEESVAALEASILASEQAEIDATVSVDELTTSLATFRAEGGLTSTAVKELEAAYKAQKKAVEDAHKSTQEAAAALGPTIVKTLGFQDALSMVADSAGGNTAELGKMLGSVEAINAVLALTGPQAETFTEKIEAMGGATGASDEAFAEMEKSTSRLWAKFKTTLNVALIKLGQKLLPIVTKVLTEDVMPAFQRLTQWFSDNKEEIKSWFQRVWAIAGPILDGFKTGFKLIVDFLVNNKPVLFAIIAALGALIVTSLGPVSLAMLAIFGLVSAVGLIKEHWDTIVGFFKGILDKVVGFFKNNWDKILAIIFPVPGIAILVARNWGQIVGVVDTIWNNVYSTVKGWIDTIVEFVKGLPGRVLEIIRDIPSMVANVIKDIPVIGDAVGAVGNIAGAAGGLLSSIKPFQHGGIVTGPTLALLGEAGPEAVIPLPNDGMAGKGTTIIVEGPIYGFDDFAAKVQEATLLGARRGRQDLLR